MGSACSASFKPLPRTRLPARSRFVVRPPLLTGTSAPQIGSHLHGPPFSVASTAPSLAPREAVGRSAEQASNHKAQRWDVGAQIFCLRPD
jgi:hypothetical protein